MPRPDDHTLATGRQAGDNGEAGIWFTAAQAAAFIGCDRQTIYGYERRGLLTDPHRDEHGRRIYTQQQIATAYATARANTDRVRKTAA